MHTRYVKISKFAELSGYTDGAIRAKIERGIGVEGCEYRRAPDDVVLVDIEGY